jgi:rhodanese-related sulfurtransferase
MNRFIGQIKHLLANVPEIMPWDLVERLQQKPETLIIDVREPDEYARMRMQHSLNIPRGILESACEWDYEETEPRLVQARDQDVVIVCRSGQRSLIAAWSLQVLGFSNVYSLKTGLRGWNDYEQPMVDANDNLVDMDEVDDFFTAKLREEQRRPN